MAWPYDARHYTFNVLGQIPASTLNEIQDQILNLNGNSVERFFINGISQKNSGGAGAAWLMEPNGLGWWSVATGGGNKLWIPMVMSVPTIVTEIYAKYYIAVAVGLTIEVYKITHNVGSAATAPSRTQIGSTHTSSGGTPPDWRVASWTGLSETIDPETDYLVVEFDVPDAGDYVGGVRVIT